MAIVLSGLAVGLLLTFFLNWYIFSINRYCLSYKFPCIDPIWNPDHDIIKDVVQKLYMTQEEKKKINSIYKQQNEKLVAGSKKTILQIATEFGLMKLIKSSIDTFDGIEIEKLFIEDTIVSFLGIACKTGSVETIKWILSCMNNKKNGKKELESQEEPLVLVDCEIFFKGITQEKEIPPISVATNPALDFLLHEVADEKWIDYYYQETGETIAHFIAREGANIDYLKKLNKEVLTGSNNKGEHPIHLSSKFGHIHVVNFFIQHYATTTDIKDETGNIPLNLASQNGHSKIAYFLLEKMVVEASFDPGHQDFVTFFGFANEDQLMEAMETCTEIIHFAVIAGNLKLFQQLIDQKGVEWALNSKDNQMQSLLHLASANGHIDILENLIKQGIDIEAKESIGRTPLHLASAEGHIDVVESLIKHGSDIEAKGKYEDTPLHFASSNGYLDIMESLIKHGSDIEATNKTKETPLHLATANGHIDVIEGLIKHGSDIEAKNNRKETPLHLASAKGNLNVMECLIKHGADIEAKRKYGGTPLHMASNEGHLNIMECLIKHGSDIESKNHSGGTPLHCASGNGHIDIMESLITKYGSDIEAKDNYEKTPLHMATLQCQVEAVKKLLHHKADSEAKDEDQTMPLHYSADAGNIEVTKILLDTGTNPLAKDECGWTALHYSAFRGYSKLCDILIEKAPTIIDVLNEDEDSALHMAVNMSKIEVIEVLLEHGAKIDLKNLAGQTPFDIAKKQNNRVLVELFFKPMSCFV